MAAKFPEFDPQDPDDCFCTAEILVIEPNEFPAQPGMHLRRNRKGEYSETRIPGQPVLHLSCGHFGLAFRMELAFCGNLAFWDLEENQQALFLRFLAKMGSQHVLGNSMFPHPLQDPAQNALMVHFERNEGIERKKSGPPAVDRWTLTGIPKEYGGDLHLERAPDSGGLFRVWQNRDPESWNPCQLRHIVYLHAEMPTGLDEPTLRNSSNEGPADEMRQLRQEARRQELQRLPKEEILIEQRLLKAELFTREKAEAKAEAKARAKEKTPA